MNIINFIGSRLTASCFCQTCGEIFFRVPLNEFINRTTNLLSKSEIPKWCVIATEHKILNPEHIIIEQSGPVSFESQGINRNAKGYTLEKVREMLENMEFKDF